MAWTRHGDNELTHPAMARLLSATAPADNPLAVDHVKWAAAFGVFSLLASVSGAHLTDGYVEMGMLSRIAPGWETEVLDILEDAGLAQRVKTADPTRPEDPTVRWMIKLDLSDEEFVHIRKKDEVELDRRRSRDSRNTDLMMEVRVRDGDQCRWCGRTVSWRARRGNRAAQIDSLNGHRDSTPETLVVSCHQCNDLRGKGKTLDLRPAPQDPYYTDHTINLVNESDWAKDHNIRLQSRQTRLPIDERSQHADHVEDSRKAARWAQAAGSTQAARWPAADSNGDAAEQEAPDRGAPGQEAPRGTPPQNLEARSLDLDMVDAPWWVLADDEETAKEVRQEIIRRLADGGDSRKAARWAQAAGSTQAARWPAADSNGDAAEQEAPDRGAPGQEAPRTVPPKPPPDTPPPEKTPDYNETVKPSPDLGFQGHGPGFVGTGRDGPDRSGTGLWPARKKRRRGRRGRRRES